MPDVGCRNDNALPSGKAARAAHIEKALDFLVDPADRLDVTMLVDRPGDRVALTKRRFGKCGEQGEKLGRRSAVSFDAAVGLLEDEAGGERQGTIAAEPSAQETGKDQHALGMDGTTQGYLALDVDELALAIADLGRDAARLTEAQASKRDDGQPIHLPDGHTIGLDAERVASDFLL